MNNKILASFSTDYSTFIYRVEILITNKALLLLLFDLEFTLYSVNRRDFYRHPDDATEWIDSDSLEVKQIRRVCKFL